MDKSCFEFNISLPTIENLTNHSTVSFDSGKSYQPNSGGLAQIISSTILRQVFSSEDFKAFLKSFVDDDEWTNDFWQITKKPPITSIIIYLIVSIVLSLIFLMVTCISSCLQCSRKKSHRRNRALFWTMMVVFMVAMGDMIYVSYRISTAKSAINKSIFEINGPVYPQAIHSDLSYVQRQVAQLNWILSSENSLVINGSKSILLDIFNTVLVEKYSINNLLNQTDRLDRNFQNLKTIVNNDPTIPNPARQLFSSIYNEHSQTIESLNQPSKILCNYSTDFDTNIDQELLNGLSEIHRSLNEFVDWANRYIADYLSPEQDHLLISNEIQDQIEYYTNLVGRILLSFVIIVGILPFLFLIFLILRRCSSSSQKSSETQLTTIRSRSKDLINSTRDRENQLELTSPSRRKVGSIRATYPLLSIMVLTLILSTTVFYSVDIFVQATCRISHENQSSLISFVLNDLFQSEQTLVDIDGLLDDCREHRHFTERFLEEYWPKIDEGVEQMLTTLNNEVYNEFQQSISNIDLTSMSQQLVSFKYLVNTTTIDTNVDQINLLLNGMHMTLLNISTSTSTLPSNLTVNTSNQFKSFVSTILQSTLDDCPLPLSTIYRVDTLICHDLANATNGLWLSILIFVILKLIGVYTWGTIYYRSSD